MRCALMIALLVVPAAVSSVTDAALPRYRLIILPDDPESFITRAKAINELGQVAGSISIPGPGISNAVFWPAADRMHEVIHGPGDDLAFANDVNDAGVVVGSAGEGEFAFAWTSGTIYEPLPAAMCCPDARAINEDGTIVGKGNLLTGGTFTAVWSDGELLDFGALQDHCCSEAMDINDLGQIVGSSEDVVALWDDGRVIEIGGLGGLFAIANGVNNRGEVVGVAHVQPPGVSRPFYWNGGPIVELPLLGGGSGHAASMNDHGVIVGVAATPLRPGQPSARATVWIDREAHDLNNLVVNLPRGAWLVTANDINNAGQIVGHIDVGETTDAFRLDPVAPADLSADGVVNGIDLGILLAHWGPCGGPENCLSDLDESGSVDGIDLGILLASWTM